MAAIVMGLFAGLIAATELGPKAFEHAWIFQTVCGAIAGAAATVTFKANSEYILTGRILGGLPGGITRADY